MATLELKGISKRFRTRVVVDNFSYQFSPGIYGLLGPNGAGKSTLIKVLAGLMKPTSGTILFNCQDVLQSKTTACVYRKSIGYLPQDSCYYKNFSVFEFMKYMCVIKNIHVKDMEREIERCLAAVNLDSKLNLPIGNYSGGMKQRVGIAQALIGSPEVLIFDEPTAGLDPQERTALKNLISSMAKDKIILIITHILSDIESIAKQAIFLNGGSIVLSGGAAELIEKVEPYLWQVASGKEELADWYSNYDVCNIYSDGDKYMIRLISREKPDGKALRVHPSLEDVYTYCFSRHIQ